MRFSLVLVVTVFLQAAAMGQMKYVGVNLAGAEFGHHIALPGEHGKHYGYPTVAEVEYFMSKGMTAYRVPFAWERLQRELNAEFHAEELQRLDGFVKAATAKGAFIILDPHNYARYHGKIIGSGPEVTNDHFADFWTRLATLYKDNDRVIFGLMNEPHGIPAEQWVETANVAMAAIRKTGAKQLILVPGVAYSGAHSWTKTHYGTSNAVAAVKLVDPGDHYAFDMHQYVDADSSGRKDVVVSPTIGAERLKAATDWLRANKKKALLGEFAVANARIGDGPDQTGDEAINSMLDYMHANSDVWIGFQWWAAGPRWGNYMFSIEPKNVGKPDQEDRPGLKLLADWLARNHPQPATRPAND